MVASDNEVKKIMRILRQYWPETSIEMMLETVWEEVAQHSDNESLKAVSYTHLTLPTNREV